MGRLSMLICLLYIYNNFFNFYCNIYDIIEVNLKHFKCSYFNNKILHLATYSTITQRYTDCYNYDTFFKLLYNIMISRNMMDVKNLCFTSDDIVMIYSFPRNNKIYKVISNKRISTDDMDRLALAHKKCHFIYCVVDDKDITHYLMDFKESIYLNDTMKTSTYVNALSHYYKNNIWMNENSYLKLMMDTDYTEKVFKAKDILNINT